MPDLRHLNRGSGNGHVGTGALAPPVERSSTAVLLAALLVLLALSSACRIDMHVQPRQNPLSRSDFYTDQRSARPVVDGSLARGILIIDHYFYTLLVVVISVDFLP